MAKTKRNIEAPPRSGTAYRIYDDMLAVAGTLLRSRKELGAEKLQAFAESARSFAGSVADMPNLKSHVTAASQTIDDLAEYVAHTDIENIIHDGGVFARRHPLATLAAAMTAGLGISLMLRPAKPHVVASKRSARPRGLKPRKTSIKAKRTANGSAHLHA